MEDDDPSSRSEELVASQMLDESLNIATRWSALFSLRNMKGSVAREALIKAMRDPSDLLAHEAAFALGQMQDREAIPALTDVLKDVAFVSSIVRHEAAEALGAIGAPESASLLKSSLESDPASEVRETCELALQKIEQGIVGSGNEEEDDAAISPFFSVDPVAPTLRTSSTPVLRKVLLDEDVGMYQRYGALFALRNRGGEEAVDAIVAALGARSALLKHEVAYVLGQLQDKCSTDALIRTLMDSCEHPMVRHEAAEALGPIADSESIALIRRFRTDPELLVAQSCEVALSLVNEDIQAGSF